MVEARYSPALLEDLIDEAAAYFSMVYSSTRALGDLCEGLIIGALRHFNETAELVREDLESGPKTRVRFQIFKSGR